MTTYRDEEGKVFTEEEMRNRGEDVASLDIKDDEANRHRRHCLKKSFHDSVTSPHHTYGTNRWCTVWVYSLYPANSSFSAFSSSRMRTPSTIRPGMRTTSPQ